MINKTWLSAASIAALALAAPTALTPAVAQEAVPAASTLYGAWGVDLAARDLAVKPGDDFTLHATGSWLATNEIPADRPSISAGWDVHERNRGHLQKLLTSGTDTQYGTLYASFMDEAAVEKAGLAPLLRDIAEVRALPDKRAFARFMGTTQGRFGISLIDAGPGADTADPTINVLWMSQGGLGLPERDYYFAPRFKPQRDAYLAYMTRTFRALGERDPAGAARTVMAFETAIAGKSWTATDRRDIGKVNNPMSSTQLMAYAPGLEWSAWFEGLGIGAQQRIIVNENTAIRDLAALYERTPLTTLKLWQAFHVSNQSSRYLTDAMVKSRFDFIRSLSGVMTIEPRWKRAVSMVGQAMGELVGQGYVRAHFPPAAKTRMEALVANLKVAMADRIRGNTWMSAGTKEAALDKLARMDVMVGYPEKFRDYSALEIKPGDLYGNMARAAKFNADYAMSDLGKPVDRKKWGMNPQEVNAYNSLLENKIVFPAGILQAPFFDLAADDAVNYGAIGAIIGHEIIHGFDDQGRKIDARGAVHDWWANSDGERFEARAKAFGEQYAKFEAAPGMFVNPTLTMGENIADYAGLEIALDAYRKSLGGAPAPVIDGLTGEQRFFLSYAQAWRDKSREDAIRQQVASDPHAPNRFRVLGPVRNMEAWYKAFGVQPGEAMYLPPEKRVVIW